MSRFDLNAKHITDDMMSATEVNVLWWAYLYWRDLLRENEQWLSKADGEADIEYWRYQVVEAKKIIVELYQKLIQFSEFQDGVINEPEWMEEFLQGCTTAKQGQCFMKGNENEN
jgi:hypothetical protein